MSLWTKWIPPYYKYSVFAFCGLQLVYCALLLAVAEKYYRDASDLFPLAYRMFDDTVKKGKRDFHWDDYQLQLFETVSPSPHSSPLAVQISTSRPMGAVHPRPAHQHVPHSAAVLRLQRRAREPQPPGESPARGSLSVS